MDVQRLARFRSIQIIERQERENVPEDLQEATPEKKFCCEFAEEAKARGGYSMNCFYFGCLHQINDDCEALKELKK